MVTHLRYGNTNTFVVSGEHGSLLVDTDYAGSLQQFYKAAKECGIKVADITYVMATHYHPDHMGLISELMSLGVKLVLMESQVDTVHFADHIFARDARLHYEPIDGSKARVVTFEDSRKFLDDLGIAGEIISTPSHSADSVSVMLDEGVAIVGDLEPYEYLAGYEDNEMLKADWDKIRSFDPETVWYAHAPCRRR